ncbi:MAG: HNH endonuclease signature motif containing protein [Actinomycetota bacterium]
MSSTAFAAAAGTDRVVWERVETDRVETDLPGGPAADWSAEVDELRCHTLEWLHAARSEAVRAQRRWRMRELAIVRVLDERGQVDDAWAAADGVTVGDVRATVETARALDALPRVAAAAADGAMSDAQLAAVVQLADASTDADWAARGPRCAPTELRREVRALATPTVEESRRRHAAKGFWGRFDEQAGRWHGGFSLPDIEGATVMAVLQARAEQMKPRKGAPWAPLSERLGEAFFEAVTGEGPERPPARAHVLVHVPVHGPAEVQGVPIAAERLEQLLANASLEINIVNDRGEVVGMVPTTTLIPTRIMRAVRTHDVHCRWPGCTSTVGLEIHHLVPRSWGGTDDINNLVVVCAPHHRRLVPHGVWALAGSPRQVGELDLVPAEDLRRTLDHRPRPGGRARAPAPGL